ncbi:CoA ester lyase [Altererythrobacter confluentis]|uniref:CoA ester lyase n=2 Tax=Allopontixanthobacter confluentis TaxID=1849021 RepID=A0A6L7GF46_9SPHN|nr:CoA ester lyase [Allopontixanthobacter confluentis]MXP14663.1 CoA ester lyase [Allopontixanthobacter confluentis]
MRPMRTALYLPANRASAVAKARMADCDAVILHLEDAVAPEAKDQARSDAVAAVTEGGFGDRLLVIRINALDSAWGPDDCAALSDARPDAVLLPKISSAADIADARALLPVDLPIWAMLETCAAFLDLGAIARDGRQNGLAAFVLGTNDLALEMRCTLDTQRSALLPLLTQAVVAARAHGLIVLDGVFNDIADAEGLASQCAQGAELGFDGKTIIHPAQLAPANTAFGPTPAQIEQASAIIAAFSAAENAGKGVIRLDGKMVELLHLRQAEQTLAIHRAITARAG